MMRYAHLLVFVEWRGLCRQADGWHGLGEGDVLAEGDDGVVPVHCIVAEPGVPHKRCRDEAKLYIMIKYVALWLKNSVTIVILFTFSVRCFGYNRISRALPETWQIRVIFFRFNVRHVVNELSLRTMPWNVLLWTSGITCMHTKVRLQLILFSKSIGAF